MKSFKKLGGIIGVVGCLQFVIFSTIAMFNYTGEILRGTDKITRSIAHQDIDATNFSC